MQQAALYREGDVKWTPHIQGEGKSNSSMFYIEQLLILFFLHKKTLLAQMQKKKRLPLCYMNGYSQQKVDTENVPLPPPRPAPVTSSLPVMGLSPAFLYPQLP